MGSILAYNSMGPREQQKVNRQLKGLDAVNLVVSVVAFAALVGIVPVAALGQTFTGFLAMTGLTITGIGGVVLTSKIRDNLIKKHEIEEEIPAMKFRPCQGEKQ